MDIAKRPARPLHRWRRGLIESDLSSRAKLVGCVLAEHMTTDELRCWPGILTIAQEATLNKRTVMRGLDDLETGGWVVRRPGQKGYATRYVGVIPQAPTSALTTPPASALSTPPTTSALESPTGAPESSTSALESQSGALESHELERTHPRTPPGTLTPLRGTERVNNIQSETDALLARWEAERKERLIRASGRAA